MSQRIHPLEEELALYASGDLDWRAKLAAMWHVRTCSRCAKIVRAFRGDVAFRKRSAEAMPLPDNWDELADEMAANIRVGLAAADAIRGFERPAAREVPIGAVRRPGIRQRRDIAIRPDWFWKPAAGVAAAMALVVTVWFATMPVEQSRAISRIVNTAFHGGSKNAAIEPLSVVLESSANGIEMRQGSRQALKIEVSGRKPEQFTANLDGSLRAQYVDDDSGQVTVTNVYAQ